MPPRKTFLYEQHSRLGGRIVDFMGWQLPVQYEKGILAEHAQCRRSACLFDTGHMGQILISGEHAADDLAGILTQNPHALPVGRARYGLLLNEDGGIRDDTILMRLGQYEFLLVVNAAPLIEDLMWLLKHASSDTHIVDQTQTWGKLDLQGPESYNILNALVDIDLAQLGYFNATHGQITGLRCIISRTGYTGELGYEIFIPAQNLDELFETFLDDPRVAPAGLGARDLLRLEMCYPLYGQDMTDQTNPFQAALGTFIHFDHEFIGSGPIRPIAEKGPEKILAAFTAETRRKPPHGAMILQDGQPVGQVTSGAWSPCLECSIGMGYVPVELAKPGIELIVDAGRAQIPVTIADKPLYKNGTCRKKNLRS
ncbi:MAG: glycine cleavage system aminomethyltransferase GcvT [Phycisphaerae bacterium]